MAKGKIDSKAQSPYKDSFNYVVPKAKFEYVDISDADDNCDIETVIKRKNLINSDGLVSTTRDFLKEPESMARYKFLNLVSNYERTNGVKLNETSKFALICRIFEFAENNNSLIYNKDDAEQFFIHKLKITDIVKIYLYKLLYQRIFDFDVVNVSDGKNIIFRSEYIESNFLMIYRHVEELCEALVYDGMILSLFKLTNKNIESMIKFKQDISLSDNVSTLSNDIKQNLSCSKEPRKVFIELLLPSTLFLARRHFYMHEGLKNNTKTILFLLKSFPLYTGHKTEDNQKAMMRAYFDSLCFLYQEEMPFTSLFNFYFLNSKTGLFDAFIMKDCAGYKPYLIDGIVCKHILANIIRTNGKYLKTKHDNRFSNTSIYNHPDCIISNISSRDYEMLDYIISTISRSCYSYYFSSHHVDFSPSEAMSVVEYMNNRERINHYYDSVYLAYKEIIENNIHRSDSNENFILEEDYEQQIQGGKFDSVDYREILNFRAAFGKMSRENKSY